MSWRIWILFLSLVLPTCLEQSQFQTSHKVTTEASASSTTFSKENQVSFSTGDAEQTQ